MLGRYDETSGNGEGSSGGRQREERKVDRRSRRPFRLFLRSHLPPLSLFSVRSVRLFQIDFRSDCHFYSPLPPHDPRLPKNAWYARLAPKEKLVEHYFSSLPLSPSLCLCLSRRSRSVGSLFRGNTSSPR